ncbi:MAG: hypothetical protein K2Y71_29385, partial [Xanthobacteraceae bacterium]|nr:hypothetical protein [Xanthobacteraceae bacterium]
GDASVGTDTLTSVESIRGSNFVDSYVATGFSGSSTNAGSNGTFNEFEGMGGNDTITGNGNTRLLFVNATAGVTVDLAAGTASGDASVGNDTIDLNGGVLIGGFTGGVNAVFGSQFGDVLGGSANASQTVEQFDGRAGNDTIDGRGGFDQAVYNNDTAVAAGISVAVSGTNTQHWTVTGDGAVGTDTLIAVESIRGTGFNDTFVATGFTGTSADTGLAASFNEFEGMGGNDTFTGNGGTRLSFVSATAGVTVDFFGGPGVGTVVGDASVGNDTFTGVSRIRGSNFNDTILGGGGNNTLEGQGGNDIINGRGGADTLTGGAGNDTFAFSAASDSTTGTVDIITDFKSQGSDLIDFSAIDADVNLANDQAFTFVANATPGVNPGVTANSITWYQSGGTTFIQADTNGDTTADLFVQLTGLKSLTAADFLL